MDTLYPRSSISKVQYWPPNSIYHCLENLQKKAFTPFSAHGNLLQTNPSLSNDEWTTECFMEFQKICTLKIIWNEKWDKSCMLSQLQEGLIIKFCNKQPLQKTLLAWSPEVLFFPSLAVKRWFNTLDEFQLLYKF